VVARIGQQQKDAAMAQDNPFQTPNSSVGATATEVAGIADVASGQKLVIYAILVYFLAIVLQFVIGPFAALLLLGTLVMAILGIVRLASGLGISIAMRIVLVILLFIPLVGLIVLLSLNSRATKALREAGYRVGLLGASK
jgi:hypothetical protein